MESVKFGNHRNDVERQIIVKLVEGFLAQGYELGVNDGEDMTLENCRDEAKIFSAMSTTDEDYLIVYKDGKPKWIRLIYGNGADVISDYLVSLEEEPALLAAEALAEQLQ